MAWAPAYASADDLKVFVRVTDAVDDPQVALAVEAASRAVDQHCRRQFGKVDAAAARRYTAQIVCGRWAVDVDDLATATGATVAVPAGPVDVFDLEPINAAADGQPFTRLTVGDGAAHLPTGTRHEVTVTGVWGWSAVPGAVKQATLLQASRFLARRDSPYGIAGSPDAGSEVRLLARVDPDVAVILGPYVRRGWAFV